MIYTKNIATELNTLATAELQEQIDAELSAPDPTNIEAFAKLIHENSTEHDKRGSGKNDKQGCK